MPAYSGKSSVNSVVVHITSESTCCGPLLLFVLFIHVNFPLETALTCLLAVYVSLSVYDCGHFPLGEKGGPYLHWWVNTTLLFITSTAQ